MTVFPDYLDEVNRESRGHQNEIVKIHQLIIFHLRKYHIFSLVIFLSFHIYTDFRVPTNSGKPGKSHKDFYAMKNHGI